MNDIEKQVTPSEEQQAEANSTESDFMADVEKSMVQLRPGQTITGTVVQITNDEVCVNVGYKADGLVKKADLSSTDVKVGDEIEVEVVKVNDGEGNVVLSQRNIVNRRNWDALMEQYGQDPGKQTSPAKENGYPVSADSTNWVTEFRDAAMALENVGDVSEPVRSEYGIHIIKYVSDAVEGEVGLDAVRDALETEVLTQKQDEAYTAAVDAWVAEADAKIYKDRLN